MWRDLSRRGMRPVSPGPPDAAVLLGRLAVVDRQAVNKAMSANLAFPEPFQQRACLFIHVPKCAGSSVCLSLFDG